MKQILSLITVLLMTFIAKAQGIYFEENLSWLDVKEKAAKEGKYIFVDCYTTWCAPCKFMDQQVYTVAEAGNVVNNKFIAIKVQMDKANNDSERIKNWYKDAKSIELQFDVNAYPTILFFNPQGVLIGRKVGAIDIKGFVDFVTEVLDPSKQFNMIFKVYSSGKMNIQDYPNFADKADQLDNHELAQKVREEYKQRYLDKLPLVKLYTKDILTLLIRNPDLIDSKDRFYLLCRDKPQMVDSIAKSLGVGLKSLISRDAQGLVRSVDVKEQITSQLFEKGNPKSDPDWLKIKKDFLSHYNKPDALQTFYVNKVRFYLVIGNLNSIADAVDENVANCNSCLEDKLFLKFSLNNWAWYQIFLKTNDKKLLERALKWSDIVIHGLPEDDGMIDTKANLLYKLGRNKEAIALEQSVVNRLIKKTDKKPIQEAAGEFYTTLMKMKNGEPTWIEAR